METNQQTFLNFESHIVEDWNGGYKLELDVTAELDLNNWEVDISLPYSIREAYGVDIIDRGNGNYTLTGQNGWANLDQGQSIKPIFVVDDYGQQAVVPEFISWDSETVIPTEETNTLEGETSTPTIDETSNQDGDIIVQPDGDQIIINVDNDFGGNLANAIASANDGDIVQLGSNVYYTNGITIDKDITIDGQEGSVINGGGTSEPIISLTQEATGATIQDIEITNGNNGIYGYSVFNLTLQNLNINNIGLSETIRDEQKNTGIVLNRADGLQLLDSEIHDMGRKGVGVNDTDGAIVSGLSVYNVNLAGQHSQSFDAAGVKFFNTNDVIVRDNHFSDINAINLWNDTTNGTTIEGNVVENVGEDFLAPDFDSNVNITGIYNEKSSNSIVRNNEGTSIDGFLAFNATEFSTETMIMEDNNFSSFEINTEDYWVNEPVERLIATTEDPAEADFSLFADEYFAQAEIG